MLQLIVDKSTVKVLLIIMCYIFYLFILLFAFPVEGDEDAAKYRPAEQTQLIRYESDEGKFSIGFPDSWEVVEGRAF